MRKKIVDVVNESLVVKGVFCYHLAFSPTVNVQNLPVYCEILGCRRLYGVFRGRSFGRV